MAHPPHDHSISCERFILTEHPDGMTELSVCWDQTNIREVAESLRRVANGLDAIPPDSESGVIPI